MKLPDCPAADVWLRTLIVSSGKSTCSAKRDPQMPLTMWLSTEGGFLPCEGIGVT